MTSYLYSYIHINTDLPFVAHSSSSYCKDLPFMVDSIDRQQFVVNCSSSGQSREDMSLQMFGTMFVCED